MTPPAPITLVTPVHGELQAALQDADELLLVVAVQPEVGARLDLRADDLQPLPRRRPHEVAGEDLRARLGAPVDEVAHGWHPSQV